MNHPHELPENDRSQTPVESLLSALRTDDPPVGTIVEDQVLDGLRSAGREEVLPALVQGLADSDSEYRCEIAALFLRYDYPTAIRHVPSLLHDPDVGVRSYLCQCLGAVGDREAIPLLVDALLHDPDGTVRSWAAWALGKTGDMAVVPTLTLAGQHDCGMDGEGRLVKDIAAEAVRTISERAPRPAGDSVRN
jgi:HEAT repeat protein